MSHTESQNGAPLSTRFWGVRGSVPTAGPYCLRFGGNTPCIEITGVAEEALILDAGTGIRPLGLDLAMRAQRPRVIHIFLTHFHWDHIQGIPYFAPIFAPDNRIVFHSAHPPERLQQILSQLMASPYFPLTFAQVGSSLEFRQVSAQPQQVSGVEISCFPLHHPQGSVGYRITHAGRTIIYATDHEHGEAAVDRSLRTVASGADVLIYDAQYTLPEFEQRRGWGHSTWLEATRVANDAGVKQLVLFHHDPDRSDEAVSALETSARLEFGNTCAAYEGLRL